MCSLSHDNNTSVQFKGVCERIRNKGNVIFETHLGIEPADLAVVIQ